MIIRTKVEKCIVSGVPDFETNHGLWLYYYQIYKRVNSGLFLHK